MYAQSNEIAEQMRRKKKKESKDNKDVSSINQKKQEKKQDMVDEDQQENVAQLQYKNGQFSKFAHLQETKSIKLKRYIEKVISEAVQSHLKQLQKSIRVEKEMQEKSNQLMTKYKSLFKFQDLLLQFMKDPIGTTLKQIQREKDNTDQLNERVDQFCQRLINLRQYAVVENKIVSIKDYKLNEYITDEEKNIYIPSKLYDNYYLKIGKSKVHTHEVFIGDQMYSRDQLAKVNREQKETIISMVYRFLQDQNILVERKQIFDRIEQKVEQMQMQYHK